MRLTDVDGNSLHRTTKRMYGPLIVGHCPPTVRAAVAKQIDKGSTYGCCTGVGGEAGGDDCGVAVAVPMVRFVSSGTEAVMSALRLGAWGDEAGHCGEVCGGLSRACGCDAGGGGERGVDAWASERSPGVPEATVHNTAVVPFNDLGAATELFNKIGNKIAAFLVEPICGNIGVVPPAAGHLEGLAGVVRSAWGVVDFR